MTSPTSTTTNATQVRFDSPRARLTAWVVAISALIIFGLVVFVIPLPWNTTERSSIAIIGVAIAALMSRYATIHAIARADSLLVRNLAGPKIVPWREIEEVLYDERGMPWVKVVLTSGEEMAVMAIQRADGPGTLAKAEQLAQLAADRA